MLSRSLPRAFRRLRTNTIPIRSIHLASSKRAANSQIQAKCSITDFGVRKPLSSGKAFHTSPATYAQSPTADAVMEDLNELYATAKDEFEIAAEETEKKTVYAADDREAAQDALKQLQEGYSKAVRESDPDVAKEVQSRVGPRIRELENAVKAMEEMALED